MSTEELEETGSDGDGSSVGGASQGVGLAVATQLHVASSSRRGTKRSSRVGGGGGPGDGAARVVRRRFVHPLDRFGDELNHWRMDDSIGSLSHMARLNLSLPSDTWERACWRAMISMEHSVVCLPIRNRRRLYTLMRSIISKESDEVGRPNERRSDSDPISADVCLPSHVSGDSVPVRGDLDNVNSSASQCCGAAHVCLCAREAVVCPSALSKAVCSSVVVVFSSDYLVPDLGLTLGHLSVFHILHARTQYSKEQTLCPRGTYEY